METLFIISLIGTIVQIIKGLFEKPIPSENWRNEKLYHKDIMDGVPIEQRIKNLKDGKYK
jgi:hypothetical protein